MNIDISMLPRECFDCVPVAAGFAAVLFILPETLKLLLNALEFLIWLFRPEKKK